MKTDTEGIVFQIKQFELLFFFSRTLCLLFGKKTNASFDWEERLEVVCGSLNLWQWECVDGSAYKTRTEVEYVELAE